MRLIFAIVSFNFSHISLQIRTFGNDVTNPSTDMIIEDFIFDIEDHFVVI